MESMGKLGAFEFKMHKNNYEKITKNLKADFGIFKPIKGQEKISDSGGFSRTIALNGALIVQPISSLKPLEDYVKNREPIRFTTLNDDIEVVITSLQTVQSHFIDDGRNTVATYNLILKEVYDAIV